MPGHDVDRVIVRDTPSVRADHVEQRLAAFLDHDLEWATAGEYLMVALVGTAAVVVMRVFV